MSRKCRTPEVLKRQFWEKVDMSAGPDGCWRWTGKTFRRGYGAFCGQLEPKGRREKRAHRWVWIFAVGPIADGLHVLHRCDNPPCVNPAHLFLGTQADNNRDRDQKGRGKRPCLGEQHNKAKLTIALVAQMRLWAATGESRSSIQRALAGQGLHIALTSVCKAVRGATWANVP